MKNKILLLGGLCLVLALGLVFIGCDSGGPVDHPDFDNIGITVTRAGNGEATGNSNNWFLVEWTAVEGARNYQVVTQPVGSIAYLSHTYQVTTMPAKYILNDDKTAFIADTNAANDDLDAFYFARNLSGVYPNNTHFKIGVRVVPLRNDRNPVITWDDTEWLLP
jgi:hypothetical protein